MNVTKANLSEGMIRAWVLEVMQRDTRYSHSELLKLITQAHHESGGRESDDSSSGLRLMSVLDDLVEERYLILVEGGHYSDYSEWRWERIADPSSILPLKEAQTAFEATAEVTVGHGQQSVYGWYLPAYRTLAAIKGHARWPMKVGRTRLSSMARMRDHIGTAPEKPKLGFLLKADRAKVGEALLHIVLDERKQNISEALGKEWYMTNPEELKQIVTTKMADLVQEDSEKEDDNA